MSEHCDMIGKLADAVWNPRRPCATEENKSVLSPSLSVSFFPMHKASPGSLAACTLLSGRYSGIISTQVVTEGM